MPNMDGTGPRFSGQFMGRGGGRRGFAGRGYGGCRCGYGPYAPYAPYAPNEKAALEAHKEALKRNLDDIEKRLESL